MMVSKPHRLFEILWRLRHPSGQFLYDFKEMLLMLTCLGAVLRLFWLMGKISTHVSFAQSKMKDRPTRTARPSLCHLPALRIRFARLPRARSN
jgi:hypothetical protein